MVILALAFVGFGVFLVVLAAVLLHGQRASQRQVRELRRQVRAMRAQLRTPEERARIERRRRRIESEKRELFGRFDNGGG